MSSISGSDSENEELQSEEEEGGGDGVISSGGRLSPRVLLQNSQGQYFCLYRCAVQKKTVSTLCKYEYKLPYQCPYGKRTVLMPGCLDTNLYSHVPKSPGKLKAVTAASQN